MKKLEVEVLKTPQELMRIQAEWLELWRASSHATVFQSPYWIGGWWKNFAEARELCVLTVRRNGKLAGIAPLCIESCASGLIEGCFIGRGISDYLDFILAEDQSAEIASALIDGIFYRTHSDALTLESLPADSPLLRAASQFGGDIVAQDVCPVLSLRSAEGSEHPFTNHRRRKLGYYRRRLERIGKLAIETTNAETFERHFNALVQLHNARWSLRAQPGVLASVSIQQFHREVARQLLGEGSLRLYLLTLDGRAAAVFYGFHHNRSTSYYLGGFLPQLEHLNAGTAIVGCAIEEAAREGASEFDFLRGDESYKYGWGATNRLTYRRTIYRNKKMYEHRSQAENDNSFKELRCLSRD